MKNKKDVIVKKRKREKVKKKSKIKPGKVVGIILAIIMVILTLALLYLFLPRVDRFNVITLRDGVVVDVGSTIDISKSGARGQWQLNVMPGDRIYEIRYTMGWDDERFAEHCVDLGGGYIVYQNNVDGWSNSFAKDKRDIVVDDDLTILVAKPSVYDYFSYVAYKGDPEDGAAAFAELSSYVDVTEYGILTDPFAELLAEE